MFGILRKDARWYSGTADREPQFGEKAAVYSSEAEAEKRVEALTKRGHVVEIIPVDVT